jgi:hypothetical protein
MICSVMNFLLLKWNERRRDGDGSRLLFFEGLMEGTIGMIGTLLVIGGRVVFGVWCLVFGIWCLLLCVGGVLGAGVIGAVAAVGAGVIGVGGVGGAAAVGMRRTNFLLKTTKHELLILRFYDKRL